MKEETQRRAIEASTTKWVAACMTLLLLGVVLVAGFALKVGAKDLTEKVLLALITGGAGYFAGRGHAAMQKKDD